MIALHDITKRYDGHVANDRITHRFAPGAITGLLGPNGAGKTTLIRMMMRILRPDAGTIHFGDALLADHHMPRMGYLPEERGLYKKMRVREHMVYLARLRGLTKREATERATHWLDRLDLIDWAERPVESLSKGMQQKMQFASTLLHDPDFIVLDEPFSGLDPVNAERLMGHVAEQKARGRTVVLSTHRMDQAQDLCDHIALVHEGRLVLSGAVDDVRDSFDEGRYHLDFDEPVDLTDTDVVTGWTPGERTGEVVLTDGYDPTDLVALVHTRGLPLREMVRRLPTLKEIFIHHVQDDAA